MTGNKATGQSHSSQLGNDGSVSQSTSGTESQTFEGPNGIKGTSSSSHSSSSNVGTGGNVSSSSSSGSGTSPFGSQTFSNSGSFGGSPFGGGAGSQTNSFSGSNNSVSNAGANAASNSINQYNRPDQFIFNK